MRLALADVFPGLVVDLRSRPGDVSVPLENLEMFERMGVIFLSQFSPMLISLTTLLATLSSIFHSRAALQLENLALRHQNRRASEVCKKTPEIDSGGPPTMGLAVPHLERLALGAGHRRARNGRGLASQGLWSLLDLEGAVRSTRTTCAWRNYNSLGTS
jgi:hypothetical protein